MILRFADFGQELPSVPLVLVVCLLSVMSRVQLALGEEQTERKMGKLNPFQDA